MDHSRMASEGPGRTATGTTDHSQHAGAAGTQPAASTNHAATGHGTPPAAPADRATDKLLTLVGELVRDPAVQQEIQKDRALREAWEDPGVRRVVTKQP
jgi:hypothetical protein